MLIFEIRHYSKYKSAHFYMGAKPVDFISLSIKMIGWIQHIHPTNM